MNDLIFLDETSRLDLKVKLYKICKKYKEKKLKIVDNLGNVYESKFLFFYNFLSNKEFLSSPWRNILIEYFSKSEALYPGSSFLLAKLISGFEKQINADNICKKNSTFENYIIKKSKIGKEFLNLLKFSGPEASIKLESISTDKTLVHKKSSSKFLFSNNNITGSLFFKNKNKIKRSIRCVVIDGFLENEKEIFLFLEKCFVEKKTGLIICRGISQKLLNFTSSFISKNKFPILIYEDKVNHLDPFKFFDFVTLNNGSIVSIDTGDDIRYDCYDKSFIIENCSLSRDFIEFKPKKENIFKIKKEIDLHKKNSFDKESLDYVNKRNKRSALSLVEIFMPLYEKKELQELKFLIHCYNSIAKFGIVSHEGNLYGKQEIDAVNKLYEKFNKTIENTSILLKYNKEK